MLKNITRSVLRKRSIVVVERVKPYITNSTKILDIGSGTGDVAFLLKNLGKDITVVDVGDFHGPRLIDPIIYDGKKLPFPDKSFDTALLLMVMHHTPEPSIVFEEAARVAREVIVIETSYTTQINKFFTVISDALGNLRIEAFWSSYKSDREWNQLFTGMGFSVVEFKKYNDHNFGLPFLHILYYLKKSN